MAPGMERTVSDSAPLGTLRPPARVAWFALLTFGIYGLVWFHRLGKEVDAAGRFDLDVPRWYRQMAILAALIVTLPVAIIHFFVYAHGVVRALEELARRALVRPPEVDMGFAVFPIPFVGVAYLAKVQAHANAVWTRMEERRRPAAAPSTPTETVAPVEKAVKCPKCANVVAVRYTPGIPTTVRCAKCGYAAPFG